MDTIRLLTLTQDALLRHTKQQEDLFVAHAKQDRTPIILKSKEGGMLQERKRSHSPDHEKGFYRPTKASRNDSNILIPPFPLPNIGYPVQYRQGKASNAPRGGNVNGGQQIVSQSGLPVSSTKLSQSNVESRATPIQSNVIWPYYPQTASGNCKDFHFDALYSRIFFNLKMITMILLVLYHHCNAFNMLQKIEIVNFFL